MCTGDTLTLTGEVFGDGGTLQIGVEGAPGLGAKDSSPITARDWLVGWRGGTGMEDAMWGVRMYTCGF